MKIIIPTFLLSLLFLCACCFTKSQTFTYKEIPTQYSLQVKSSQKERDSIKVLFKRPYLLVNSLPKGYVRDGTRDYTLQIQKAFDNYKEIILPNFPLLINEKGITVSSNSKIYFDEKSKMILKPSSLGQYEILRIHDVENVSIYFANIVGDRYKHQGDGGEWGMGISLRGTDNITLYAPAVKNCWGDGIYLGISPVTNNVINNNVSIFKGLVDDNRRNGMSIISAQNLKVDKFVTANSSGKAPNAGIDIEPDSNSDIIKNLTFANVISFNNETHGLLFALGMLSGKAYDIGTINIKNFTADTGYLGVSFKLANDQTVINPKGTINVTNSRFRNMSRAQFLSYDENSHNNINVNVKLGTENDDATIIKQLNNSIKIRVQK